MKLVGKFLLGVNSDSKASSEYNVAIRLSDIWKVIDLKGNDTFNQSNKDVIQVCSSDGAGNNFTVIWGSVAEFGDVVSGHGPREDPVWHENTAAEQAATDASMKSMSWHISGHDADLANVEWKASLDEFRAIYGIDDKDDSYANVETPRKPYDCLSKEAIAARAAWTAAIDAHKESMQHKKLVTYIKPDEMNERR